MKNQVKVTKTETYKDSQGEHIVCKGKLVLIRIKGEEAFNIPNNIVHGIPNCKLTRHIPAFGIGDYYKPIIISETETIEKYDFVYNDEYKTIYQWIKNADIKFDKIIAKKIIALPEQFSSKHLQAIIDGKLKDGDDVYVECTNIVHPEWDKPIGTEWHETILKMFDKHIKLFPIKKEQTTFTKDELYWACIKCVELYEAENQVIDSKRFKTPTNIVESWLSKNYK